MLGDSVRRRQPAKTPRSRKPRAKKIRWRVVIPVTLAALLLPFAVGYAVAVYVLFPPPEASGMGIAVPDLVGRSVSESNQLLASAGLGVVDTTVLPHPDAPPGQVLAQDPLPGQQLRAGTDVRVSVSGGRPQITVPDVEGFSAEAAEQVLQRLGFDTRRITESSFTSPGRVLRLDPDAGTRQRLPATITIVVSEGYGAPLEPAYPPDDSVQPPASMPDTIFPMGPQ